MCSHVQVHSPRPENESREHTVIEDEGQEQMPEQARSEAWRCIRWLVAVWALILVVGTWAAIEIFG